MEPDQDIWDIISQHWFTEYMNREVEMFEAKGAPE